MLYILYSSKELPSTVCPAASNFENQSTTVQEFMFSRVLYVGGGPTVQRFYNLDSQEKKYTNYSDKLLKSDTSYSSSS